MSFSAAAGRIAAAGFLLSADKRNKNSWRPFNLLDFLSLAASPQPKPLALQARLLGLLYIFLSLRSWEIYLCGFGLKIYAN
jgi:hypothetical protein